MTYHLPGKRAQLGAERLVRVFLFVLVGLGIRGIHVAFDGGRVSRVDRCLDLVDDAGGGIHLGHEVLVENRLVLVAVDVGTVVGRHVVGVHSGVGGDLLGERVGEHLGRSLGLVGLVDVQSVVHDRVRLRVVDVDVVQVLDVDLVLVLIDDVDGEVLGRRVGGVLFGEDVALLGFVILRGLLRSGRPVGVVDISFRQLRSLPFRGRRIRGSAPRCNSGGQAGTPKTTVVTQTNSRSSP